jgi:hypothetical protein
MNGPTPELIDLLNNSYAYNDDKILTVHSTSSADLDVYLTHDKYGIVYGLVEMNVTGKLDG